MKTNSFVAFTGSASSPAIMLERSCFHRICELPIMWEQRSERRRRPARVARGSQLSSSSLEHSDARWSGGLCWQQRAAAGSSHSSGFISSQCWCKSCQDFITTQLLLICIDLSMIPNHLKRKATSLLPVLVAPSSLCVFGQLLIDV